jgi:hypothetical protein
MIPVWKSAELRPGSHPLPCSRFVSNYLPLLRPPDRSLLASGLYILARLADASAFPEGDDKLLAIERIRMNHMGISSGVWRWDHVLECLLDLKTWLWFSMLTAVSIPSGGNLNLRAPHRKGFWI